MNRKLHNSLTAAMACSLLLVVALLVSAPADSVTSPAFTAAPSVGQADVHTEAPRGERPLVRRSYQSVRMPFFSFFSPRG